MCGLVFVQACGAGVSLEPVAPKETSHASESRVRRACSPGMACPDGEVCFDGLCSSRCRTGDDCLADEYCDAGTFGTFLCVAKAVTTCPETACTFNQLCQAGFCSTPPPADSCSATGSAQDDCGRFALCSLDEVGRSSHCSTFPPCPQTGPCPLGTRGAVCNDGYAPDKARFCLSGMCRADEHCPSGWACRRTSPVATLGYCTEV